MYVWRMEKIMAENFREWKMLQQCQLLLTKVGSL